MSAETDYQAGRRDGKIEALTDRVNGHDDQFLDINKEISRMIKVIWFMVGVVGIFETLSRLP